MKHIKEYNISKVEELSYLQEYFDLKRIQPINQTYTKIDTSLFKEIKFYTISQRDIDFITKSISMPITNTPDPKGIAVNSVIVRLKYHDLHILMDGDEYFYIVDFVYGGYNVYKCDQREGLIDCLKEIYSI